MLSVMLLPIAYLAYKHRVDAAARIQEEEVEEEELKDQAEEDDDSFAGGGNILKFFPGASAALLSEEEVNNTGNRSQMVIEENEVPTMRQDVWGTDDSLMRRMGEAVGGSEHMESRMTHSAPEGVGVVVDRQTIHEGHVERPPPSSSRNPYGTAHPFANQIALSRTTGADISGHAVTANSDASGTMTQTKNVQFFAENTRGGVNDPGSRGHGKLMDEEWYRAPDGKTTEVFGYTGGQHGGAYLSDRSVPPPNIMEGERPPRPRNPSGYRGAFDGTVSAPGTSYELIDDTVRKGCQSTLRDITTEVGRVPGPNDNLMEGHEGDSCVRISGNGLKEEAALFTRQEGPDASWARQHNPPHCIDVRPSITGEVVNDRMPDARDLDAFVRNPYTHPLNAGSEQVPSVRS